MKTTPQHLLKFNANQVSEWVRKNVAEHGNYYADRIMAYADKNGFIYDFIVNDWIGDDIHLIRLNFEAFDVE